MNPQIFAIPVAQGQLCMHFGHCEQFAIVTVTNDKISQPEMLTPPPHEPGLLPRWLAEKNVTTVIAGGMGQRAQMIFNSCGISVITGATPAEPTELVKAYINDNLECGENACDH